MNIGIIRYNNKTEEELDNWKIKNGYFGCIYNTNKEISNSFKPNSNIYIIEVNTDKNKIIGIGLIKNNAVNKRVIIHKDPNKNRYTYMSKYHINSIELEIMDVKILMDMENKLLKGCRHMKRGEGITKVDMDRFTVVLPTKPRKVYKCKTCGRPKKKCKKCPGKRVEPKERKEKVCRICFKPLKTYGKGHVCQVYKKSDKYFKRLKTYHDYFNSLFKED